jgi:hypothetical protein
MAGHARILNAGPVSLFHQHIAVADAAGLNLMRTCPRPGCGMGRSTTSKLPPGLLIWKAFMEDLVRYLAYKFVGRAATDE